MIDSHTHLHVCKPDDAELVASAAQLGEVGVVEALCLVGVPADRRQHLRKALGGLERLAAGDRVRSYGQHPRHAELRRGGDELGIVGLADV